MATLLVLTSVSFLQPTRLRPFSMKKKKKFTMDKATELGALIIALSPIALAMFLILKACQ